MADAHLLTDIRIALHNAQFRPVYSVDVERRRTASDQGQRMLSDLATTSGKDNLAQAIILRLLTPRGELAALAHPEYGSRLHEVVGARNTETTRNLIRLHILEALRHEPRIEKVIEIEVAPHPAPRSDERGRHLVLVRLTVKPIGGTDRLELGPFTLEL